MDRKQQPLANAARRDFLGSVAVLGGSAAVVAVSGGLMLDEPATTPGAPADTTSKLKYRLTPHIQTYYEKANF